MAAEGKQGYIHRKGARKGKSDKQPFTLSTFMITFNTNTTEFDADTVMLLLNGIKSWYDNIEQCFLLPDSGNLKKAGGGYQVDDDGLPKYVLDPSKIALKEIEFSKDNVEIGDTGRLHIHIPVLRFVHNTFIQIDSKLSTDYLNEYIGLKGGFMDIKYYHDPAWINKNYAEKKWGWKLKVPK